MKKILGLLCRPAFGVALMAVVALLLAVATFVEHAASTRAAQRWIYFNPALFAIYALAAASMVCVLAKGRYFRLRKAGMALMHTAFLFILAGAWVTHVFGYEGYIHLRVGQTTEWMTLRGSGGGAAGSATRMAEAREAGSGERVGGGRSGVEAAARRPLSATCPRGKARTMGAARQLPFAVTLDRFTVERYPGSGAPSAFRSELTIVAGGVARQETLEMNRIVRQDGFRLYQSSYDPDGQGSILSVNYDPVGAPLSYTGYFMIFAGTALILLGPGSRFGQLRRRLREQLLKTAVVLAASIVMPWAAFSQTPVVSQAPVREMVAAQAASTATALARETQPGIVMVPAEHAARFGRLIVQSPSGRMEPMNTYSGELLRKIAHRSSLRGRGVRGLQGGRRFNSDQALVSLLFLPSQGWATESFIYQPDPALARKLGVPDGSLSFSRLSDHKVEMKLSELTDAAFARDPAQRSATEKSAIKLVDRLSVLSELLSGRMLPLFPREGDPTERTGRWYSAGDDLSQFRGIDSTFVSDILVWYREELARSARSGDWSQPDRIVDMIARYQQVRSTVPLPNRSRVETEILYNRLGIMGKSAAAYATVAALLLAASIAALLRPRRWLRVAGWALVAAFAAILIAHTLGIGLRWYVSGQPPWSNSYETMVFVAWSAAVAGLCFVRRGRLPQGTDCHSARAMGAANAASTGWLATALAGMLAAAVLMVAHLNFIDPQITPLVPVLKSPWLMIHVATITSSYALLGMSFLLGALSLFIMAFARRGQDRSLGQGLGGQIGALRIMNELSLTMGLCLLVCGTFIGAIWANESWGRYWGWDPKESWALISVLVYAIVLHASRFIRRLQSDRAFSVMTVLAFASILMTWFGVNYLLGGLHSYGG